MVMPSRRSSSGMQSIRRELQRRRPKPLAPKTSVAKETSAPPPRPPRQEDPSPTISKSPPASAGAHATRPPLPQAQPSPCPAVISPSTPPLSCSAPSSAGSACRASPTAAAHLKTGTAVGVRTRTTKLKTGKVLVLWLRAMVVSTTHQGYDVVCDGNWELGDPYGTVHSTSLAHTSG
ncbi:hypothetical protein HU200_010250 [Digitaria exilis]|uniref:Uncharacterized protein n=1 Tax=Digitaria exilis TaxID=1010633 RepID=A0A835FJZ7_9POAL|nr:hypothetical protein HU200_010250 [Digitaria exilis]